MKPGRFTMRTQLGTEVINQDRRQLLTTTALGIAAAAAASLSDIEAARAELVDRGVDVSEVFHRTGRAGRVSGPDPARRSYASLASFSDPDGNGWLLQEVTMRLSGRV
jgi:hypothetical protein